MEQATQVSFHSPRHRTASAALVILLHLAVIAGLLKLTVEKTERNAGPAETMLTLVPPARSLVAPSKAVGSGVIAPKAWIVPEIAVPPDTSTLGLSLFACTPENFSNLSAESKARCHMLTGNAPGHGWTAYRALPSQSRYRAMWQAALAARHKPLRVDCATAVQIKPPPGMPDTREASAIIVDPICLGTQILRALVR